MDEQAAGYRSPKQVSSSAGYFGGHSCTEKIKKTTAGFPLTEGAAAFAIQMKLDHTAGDKGKTDRIKEKGKTKMSTEIDAHSHLPVKIRLLL